jgi:hypothetical protein
MAAPAPIAGARLWDEVTNSALLVEARSTPTWPCGVAAPVFVSVARCDGAEVDVGVLGHAARVVRPDFEDHGLAVGTILQVMPVRLTRLEAGTVARVQHFLSSIGHQHHFAFDDVDELVVVAVPVPLTGPRTGRKSAQVHSEARESGGGAKAPAFATAAGHVKRLGIHGAETGGRFLDDDLLHGGDCSARVE